MRKTTAAAALGVAATAGAGTVQINEIRIDHIGTDTEEYFELLGDPGVPLEGLTYLVIGDGAAGSGQIEAVVDLAGGSLDAAGLFVAAEATFSLGAADLVTDLNFENSDNVTHLLVSGFAGVVGDDLDTDDDGVLDAEPWASILDCVALIETPGGGDQVYCGTTVGPEGRFVPGHVYRCTPDGDWTIGTFDPPGTDDTPGAANPACPGEPVTGSCCVLGTCAVVTEDDCLALGGSYFGDGSGCADHGCPAGFVVAISELRTDQPATDKDEYVELAATPGSPLDGFTYVVIGDGEPGGSGVIEEAVPLDGLSVPGSGLFVAAEETFTLGTADLTVDLNFENDDNVTHLVVVAFTGSVGADLDTDDDGVLDDAPWFAVADCVALLGPGDDRVYCSTTVGPDGSFAPGHVYRCDATHWTIGRFDPAGGDDTPGAANASCLEPLDLDGDGVVGFGDAATLLAGWGPCVDRCPGDFDGDLLVGVGDLLELLVHWGARP